jgi:hypothetical protein
MAAAGALGIASIWVPFVEIGIAVSVVALGATHEAGNEQVEWTLVDEAYISATMPKLQGKCWRSSRRPAPGPSSRRSAPPCSNRRFHLKNFGQRFPPSVPLKIRGRFEGRGPD